MTIFKRNKFVINIDLLLKRKGHLSTRFRMLCLNLERVRFMLLKKKNFNFLVLI
jgi:hypothetical protein